jgi:hypothetical protein
MGKMLGRANLVVGLEADPGAMVMPVCGSHPTGSPGRVPSNLEIFWKVLSLRLSLVGPRRLYSIEKVRARLGID